jgi:ATP-binding cassette subfamily F protein 3
MQKNPQIQEKSEEKPKIKKTYTTPLKEIGKKERAVKKAEEKIAVLEEKIEGLKTELCLEENLSDYLKLSELQKELDELQTELDIAYSEWEQFSAELEGLLNP